MCIYSFGCGYGGGRGHIILPHLEPSSPSLRHILPQCPLPPRLYQHNCHLTVHVIFVPIPVLQPFLTLDPVTGDVALVATLDFETQTSHIVGIQACDPLLLCRLDIINQNYNYG